MIKNSKLYPGFLNIANNNAIKNTIINKTVKKI